MASGMCKRHQPKGVKERCTYAILHNTEMKYSKHEVLNFFFVQGITMSYNFMAVTSLNKIFYCCLLHQNFRNSQIYIKILDGSFLSSTFERLPVADESIQRKMLKEQKSITQNA